MTLTDTTSSWIPMSLEEIINGTYIGPQPSMLNRIDGAGLLYPGAVHSIAGEAGSGKSWLALVAAAERINAGRNVLYLDFEDSPRTAVHRLKSLGVQPLEILLHFGYVRPDEPMPEETPEILTRWLDLVDLVVLDGVTNALETHNLDPLSNRDAAQFMNRFVSRLGAGTLAPAVLMIDHVAKATYNRRSPIGAQHKVAAVQVQYLVKTVVPFDQDHDGAIDVHLVKDRFGEVQRKLAVAGPTARWAARIHFEHDAGDGLLKTTIRPPGTPSRKDTLQAQVLAVVRTDPGVSKTGIVRSVTGKDSEVAATIDALVSQEELQVRKNGRANSYVLARDQTAEQQASARHRPLPS